MLERELCLKSPFRTRIKTIVLNFYPSDIGIQPIENEQIKAIVLRGAIALYLYSDPDSDIDLSGVTVDVKHPKFSPQQSHRQPNHCHFGSL